MLALQAEVAYSVQRRAWIDHLSILILPNSLSYSLLRGIFFCGQCMRLRAAGAPW